MFKSVLQLVLLGLMLSVEIRKRKLVQTAADDCLRLVLLGNDDAVNPVLFGGNPAITAHEVDVARALHEKLSHDRVVVVVLGQVAIGATLGLAMPRLVGVRIASSTVGSRRGSAHRMR